MMSANWWVEGGSWVAVIMIFFNAEGARLMIFERERGDLFSDFGYLNSGTGDGGDDRVGGNLSVRN